MTTVSEQVAQGLFPSDIITETCNCGHNIDHEKVGLERVYGFWMGVAQFLGVTPVPKELIWYCRQCGKEFASTTDRDICNYYSI